MLFFLSPPHLVDIQVKNVDEGGRNFMCKRTLPRRIVEFYVRKKLSVFH